MQGPPQTPDKSGFANINADNILKAPIACLSGCFILVIINGLIGYFFVLPAFKHRDMIKVCFNHRQAITRGMQAKFSAIDNIHLNRTPVLEVPANLKCPEEGTYSLKKEGSVYVLHCSIADHDRSGKAAFAMPKVSPLQNQP
ncbi:MAG: hypothetical protein ABJA67_09885 [Chthonomonadales bacterium]